RPPIRERVEEMYVLPDLDYDYSALEPFYSAEILDLHHNHHHAAYVSGLNSAVAELDDARERNDFTTIQALERKLAFNLAGHVLHSLLWKNLSPGGGGKPEGELAGAIEEHFGSFELFRRQLSQVVTSVQGSGWGLLVWEPLAETLYVTQIYDHQDNVCVGSRPLLALDGWEHAYYLQYRSARVDYVDAMWNIINWDAVAARFARAQHIPTLYLAPAGASGYGAANVGRCVRAASPPHLRVPRRRRPRPRRRPPQS